MSKNEKRIEELEKILKEDSGAEEFLELAQLYAKSDRAAAREVLFKGLSIHADNAVARLLLAKLFYEDRMGEFCVRELVELKKYSDAPSLEKLITGFGEFAHAFVSSPQSASAGVPKESDESKLEAKEAEQEAQEDDDGDDEEDVLAEFDLESDFDDAFDEIDED